ncbi:MAG: ribose-phosphate diphosphokinase [Patescibacteria group bacterium]|nr:ribose-phosphate diphosphokinase [Patescibacteria group bacterium]
MVIQNSFVVLGGTGNHDLDKGILAVVNDLARTRLSFLHLNMDDFSDGEDDFRITHPEKIAGKHVILFQSLHSDSRQNLERQFLTLAWAAKFQYGAKSIVAVVPFMSYRRQDHPEKTDEIHRNLWLLHNMKANGVDKLILCDIHSCVTLENCKKVGIEAWNVDPSAAFAEILKPRVDLSRSRSQPFFVYSPDKGSIRRAVSLAREFGVPVIVSLKNRLHDCSVAAEENPEKLTTIEVELAELQEKFGVPISLAEESLNGASICIREDELSTGATAVLTGKSLKQAGAKEIFFCATHPVCTKGWKRKIIDNNPFDAIILGDTVPRPYRKETGGEVITVSMARVIANQLFVIIMDSI